MKQYNVGNYQFSLGKKPKHRIGPRGRLMLTGLGLGLGGRAAFAGGLGWHLANQTRKIRNVMRGMPLVELPWHALGRLGPKALMVAGLAGVYAGKKVDDHARRMYGGPR